MNCRLETKIFQDVGPIWEKFLRGALCSGRVGSIWYVSSGQPVASTQGPGYCGMFQHRIRNQDYLVPVLPLPPTAEQASGPRFLSYKAGLRDRFMSSHVLTLTIHGACNVTGTVVRVSPAFPCVILTTVPYSTIVSYFLLD